MVSKNDEMFIEKSIEIAWKAREKGNHPFGALIVDPDGNIIITAENAVVTSRDCTAHAELLAVREASMGFDREFLSKCTLYASTEPCPMCAGAIYWGNILRLAFGLSQEGLYEITGLSGKESLIFSCEELFSKGNKEIQVIGPLLEEKARKVHENFW